MDGAVAQSEWDRLAGLQQALRSVDGGEILAGPVEAAGRGVRLRLARLALDEAIRVDGERRARCAREEFEQALAGIVERVELRALSSPPPPAPGSRAPAAAAPPSPVRTPAPKVPAAARAARSAPFPPAAPTPVPAAPPAPVRAAPAAKPKRARRPRVQPAPLPEFWTPGLILGFRMWELRGRLYGAWLPWDRPEFEARCLSRRGGKADLDVPHTDGRCGHPPCGLYCFKEPEQLLAAFGMPTGSGRFVLGLVALSGKVVEHEYGYRAQKARAVAAVVVGRGQVVRVEGDARLRSLFTAPDATVADLVAADPAVAEDVGDPLQAAEAVLSYLRLARDFRLPSD